MSTDTRSSVDRHVGHVLADGYVDQHVGRHISRHSDRYVDRYRLLFQPICRSVVSANTQSRGSYNRHDAFFTLFALG